MFKSLFYPIRFYPFSQKIINIKKLMIFKPFETLFSNLFNFQIFSHIFICFLTLTSFFILKFRNFSFLIPFLMKLANASIPFAFQSKCFQFGKHDSLNDLVILINEEDYSLSPHSHLILDGKDILKEKKFPEVISQIENMLKISSRGNSIFHLFPSNNSPVSILIHFIYVFPNDFIKVIYNFLDNFESRLLHLFFKFD